LGVRAPLEHLLELLFVPRKLSRQPAGEERSKQPADPVPPELARDRDARPLAVIERRNRAFGDGDDGMRPTPWFTQVLGGCSSSISSVYRTFQGPTRRVARTLEPTASGPSLSRRTDTTLSIHSV